MRCIFTILMECIAIRLRKHGIQNRNISIMMRNPTHSNNGSGMTKHTGLEC